MIPLQKVDLKATIQGPIAYLSVEMLYKNTSKSPIEVTYEFPLGNDLVLTNLEVKVDDKVISTEVVGKG